VGDESSRREFPVILFENCSNFRQPSAEPSINALHRVPKLVSLDADPGGLLICATDEELLFCSLVAQEQGIVRRLRVDGVPRHLLYSDYLQKFVVAFERTHLLHNVGLESASGGPVASRRLSHHPGNVDKHPSSARKMQQVGLQLVEPGLKGPAGLSMIVTEETNESVNALIHWAPTDGEHHYEWFVLALEQKEPGFPQCSGRVVCVNAKSLSKGSPDSNPKIAFRSPGQPVTAICAYKMSSLLIAVGRELHLHHLDFATRKWKTLAKHALPSPANAVTCQGSIIFVATRQHSLYVLAERDDKLYEHKADVEARCTVDAVAFDGGSVMFSAWNAGVTDVVAFSGFRRAGDAPIPLFHATLPLLVNHIRLDPRSGGRCRFYASASDGTFFHLSLLDKKEWNLLRLLEEMSYLEKKAIKAVPLEKKAADGHFHVIRTSPDLKDLHVRGDRLLTMVEQGPYNLRTILKRSDQLTERMFHASVKNLFGDVEQPVETVMVWLRKLLRYPPR
jgi:hypothetical protein